MARPEVTGRKVFAGRKLPGVDTNETDDDDSQTADDNEPADGELDLDWIDIHELCRIMGDCSRSSVYEDPELQALAVRFAEPGRRTKRVRWLRHEAHALVKRRLAQRDAAAETVRQDIAARRERRKAKRRTA